MNAPLGRAGEVRSGLGARWTVEARTHSAADTRALGAALAAVLRAGDVVLVEGELGSGKTTLAQGIAAGLGVAGQVTSPTFTLVRAYDCCAGERRKAGAHRAGDAAVRVLLHADLYRLDHLAEVADLALGEWLEEGAVAVVEWGDKAGAVLEEDALHVHLDMGPTDDDRRVVVAAPSSWAPRRAALERLARLRARPHPRGSG